MSLQSRLWKSKHKSPAKEYFGWLNSFLKDNCANNRTRFYGTKFYGPAFLPFPPQQDNLRPAARLFAPLRCKPAVSPRHSLRLHNMHAAFLSLHARPGTPGAPGAGAGDGAVQDLSEAITSCTIKTSQISCVRMGQNAAKRQERAGNEHRPDRYVFREQVHRVRLRDCVL